MLEAERAHQLTLSLIHVAGGIKPINLLLQNVFAAPTKPVQAFGLNFANPIGLAAGYDKDGLGWRGLACLGFGHIEIGTVTPQPQPGNPKPRLFRLASEGALINRLGFPGRGGDFVKKQLSGPRPKGLILGVNIGKNKDTPLEAADQDYLELLRSFYTVADYLTINVSSPNTVGLRRLQGKFKLDHLLSRMVTERDRLAGSSLHKLPLLVKLSPDLSDEELDDALEVILENHVEGIVASNTTLSRQGVQSHLAGESGGLSGKPLFKRSLEMVGKIHQQTNGKIPIVGVGGIDNTTSVQKMLDAGAVLVQIYTGLVFEGPGLVKKILRELPR
jgi:dihydroorotate dehydrogenase